MTRLVCFYCVGQQRYITFCPISPTEKLSKPSVLLVEELKISTVFGEFRLSSDVIS